MELGGSLSSEDIFRTRGDFSDDVCSFSCKKLVFFEIYGVFARTRGKEGWASAKIFRTRGEGVEPVRTFCKQGGKVQFFRDFVRTSFMDGPLSIFSFDIIRNLNKLNSLYTYTIQLNTVGVRVIWIHMTLTPTLTSGFFFPTLTHDSFKTQSVTPIITRDSL